MMKHLTLLGLMLPGLTIAAAPTWQIDPKESSIIFTATQNNAPVSGKFTSFKGEIDFSADQLSASKVDITVQMDSVNTAFQQIADLLKTADWLDVKSFSQATFTSNKITKEKDNTYQASGKLTIKNKSVSLDVPFSVENKSNNQLHVKGETVIKRTAFGIGQGEWSSTNEIKDEVKVSFDLSLNQASAK